MPVFVVFGLTTQVLLLAFFAAHLWRPAEEPLLGRLVYGAGGVAAVLAVAFAIGRQPWPLVLAFVLYATWAGLGASVDLVHPVPWRNPPRLVILVPFVVLLTAAEIALWVPLWGVHPALWLAFGILFGMHTTLNLLAHRATRNPRHRRGPHPG